MSRQIPDDLNKWILEANDLFACNYGMKKGGHAQAFAENASVSQRNVTSIEILSRIEELTTAASDVDLMRVSDFHLLGWLCELCTIENTLLKQEVSVFDKAISLLSESISTLLSAQRDQSISRLSILNILDSGHSRLTNAQLSQDLSSQVRTQRKFRLQALLYMKECTRRRASTISSICEATKSLSLLNSVLPSILQNRVTLRNIYECHLTSHQICGLPLRVFDDPLWKIRLVPFRAYSRTSISFAEMPSAPSSLIKATGMSFETPRYRILKSLESVLSPLLSSRKFQTIVKELKLKTDPKTNTIDEAGMLRTVDRSRGLLFAAVNALMDTSSVINSMKELRAVFEHLLEEAYIKEEVMNSKSKELKFNKTTSNGLPKLNTTDNFKDLINQSLIVKNTHANVHLPNLASLPNLPSVIKNKSYALNNENNFVFGDRAPFEMKPLPVASRSQLRAALSLRLSNCIVKQIVMQLLHACLYLHDEEVERRKQNNTLYARCLFEPLYYEGGKVPHLTSLNKQNNFERAGEQAVQQLSYTPNDPISEALCHDAIHLIIPTIEPIHSKKTKVRNDMKTLHISNIRNDNKSASLNNLSETAKSSFASSSSHPQAQLQSNSVGSLLVSPLAPLAHHAPPDKSIHLPVKDATDPNAASSAGLISSPCAVDIQLRALHDHFKLALDENEVKWNKIQKDIDNATLSSSKLPLSSTQTSSSPMRFLSNENPSNPSDNLINFIESTLLKHPDCSHLPLQYASNSCCLDGSASLPIASRSLTGIGTAILAEPSAVLSLLRQVASKDARVHDDRALVKAREEMWRETRRVLNLGGVDSEELKERNNQLTALLYYPPNVSNSHSSNSSSSFSPLSANQNGSNTNNKEWMSSAFTHADKIPSMITSNAGIVPPTSLAEHQQYMQYFPDKSGSSQYPHTSAGTLELPSWSFEEETFLAEQLCSENAATGGLIKQVRELEVIEQILAFEREKLKTSSTNAGARVIEYATLNRMRMNSMMDGVKDCLEAFETSVSNGWDSGLLGSQQGVRLKNYALDRIDEWVESLGGDETEFDDHNGVGLLEMMKGMSTQLEKSGRDATSVGLSNDDYLLSDSNSDESGLDDESKRSGNETSDSNQAGEGKHRRPRSIASWVIEKKRKQQTIQSEDMKMPRLKLGQQVEFDIHKDPKKPYNYNFNSIPQKSKTIPNSELKNLTTVPDTILNGVGWSLGHFELLQLRGFSFPADGAHWMNCKCGFTADDSDIFNDHANNECPFRACELCGFLPMTFHARDMHCQFECPLRSVICSLCGENVQSLDLTTHLKTKCPALIDICKFCQCLVPKVEMALHLTENCTKRPAQCSLCKATLPKEDISHHMASLCPLRPTQCPDCRLFVPFDQFANHCLSECPLRRVDCSFCHQSLPFNELDRHISFFCSERLVTCSQCKKSDIPFSSLDNHKRNLCTNRPILCPQGCEAQVPLSVLSEHLEKHCDLRKIQCNQCMGLFPFRNLESQHKKLECPRRPMQCEFCKGTYPLSSLEHHKEKLCESRPVDCNLCGENVTVGTLFMHQRDKCPKRKSGVCNQCGETGIQFDLLDQHKTEECPNRPLKCPQCQEGNIPYSKLAYHMEKICQKRTENCHQCSELIMFDEMEEHLSSECPQRIVKCPKCREGITFASIDDHLDEMCPLRMVECNLCHQQVQAQNFDFPHLAAECPQRPLKCQLCFSAVPAEAMSVHLEHDCPKRLTTCDLCGLKVPLDELEAPHKTIECKKRQVECHLCHSMIPWDELETPHWSKNCPHRPVDCSLCHSKVAFQDLESHMASTCPMRLEECDLCHQFLPSETLSNHKVETCPQRSASCTLCDAPVTYADMQQHLNLSCPKRLVKCPLCDEDVQFEQLDSEHLPRICPKRLVECDLCHSQVASDSLLYHKGTLCTHRFISCPHCNSDVQFHALNDHILNSCLKRPTRCHQCNEEVPFEFLADPHLSSECRKRSVDCSQCMQPIIFEKMDDHLMNECQKRQVACDRCGENMHYDHLINVHAEKECRKRVVTCNLDCKQTGILAEDIENHQLSECPNRLVVCDACGEENIRFCELDKPHKSEECSRRLVSCERCNKSEIAFKDLENHWNNDCVMRGLGCDQCGQQVTAADMDVHKRNECMKRLVACEKCKLEGIMFDEMEEHLSKFCPFRGSSCDLCHSPMNENEIADHKATVCPKMLVACPNECKEQIEDEPRILRDELDYHLKNICPKRLVECDLCKESFTAEVLNSHKSESCVMRLLPCPQCGLPLPVSSHPAHLKDDCLKRQTRCDLCHDESIMAEELDRHRNEQCPQRLVSCQVCLAENITTASKLEEHLLNDCPKRDVECNLCLQKIPLDLLEDPHKTMECPKRTQKCIHCDADIVHNEMEEHVKDFCPNAPREVVNIEDAKFDTRTDITELAAPFDALKLTSAQIQKIKNRSWWPKGIYNADGSPIKDSNDKVILNVLTLESKMSFATAASIGNKGCWGIKLTSTWDTKFGPNKRRYFITDVKSDPNKVMYYFKTPPDKRNRLSDIKQATSDGTENDDLNGNNMFTLSDLVQANYDALKLEITSTKTDGSLRNLRLEYPFFCAIIVLVRELEAFRQWTTIMNKK